MTVHYRGFGLLIIVITIFIIALLAFGWKRYGPDPTPAQQTAQDLLSPIPDQGAIEAGLAAKQKALDVKDQVEERARQTGLPK